MGGAQVTAPLFPLRASRFDDPETTKQAPGLTGRTGPTWGFCQGYMKSCKRGFAVWYL